MFKNRNNRTAAGAYEEPLQGNQGARPGRRGFGPLDPDEAWDTHVGTEADAYGAGGYYEEQELGVAPRHTGGGGSHLGDDTSYGGGSYAMNLAATPRSAVPEEYGGADEGGHTPRGRTASREGLAAPGGGSSKNPFDDDADPSNVSMRGVSPRPIDTSAATAAGAGGQAKDGDSPTSRKSVFRENM
jgi:hypothetical protein